MLREVAASEQASIIRKTGVTEKERHPDNDEHGGPWTCRFSNLLPKMVELKIMIIVGTANYKIKLDKDKGESVGRCK